MRVSVLPIQEPEVKGIFPGVGEATPIFIVILINIRENIIVSYTQVLFSFYNSLAIRIWRLEIGKTRRHTIDIIRWNLPGSYITCCHFPA